MKYIFSFLFLDKLYLLRYSLSCFFLLFTFTKFQAQTIEVSVTDCSNDDNIENVFFVKSGYLIDSRVIAGGIYKLNKVYIGDSIQVMLFGFKDTILVIDNKSISICLSIESNILDEVLVSTDSVLWGDVFGSAFDNSRKVYKKNYRNPRVYSFSDNIYRDSSLIYSVDADYIKLLNFSNKNFFPVIKFFKCDTINYYAQYDTIYEYLRGNLTSFSLLRNYFIFSNFYFNEIESNDYSSLAFNLEYYSEKFVILNTSFDLYGVSAENKVRVSSKDNVILDFYRVYQDSLSSSSANRLGLVNPSGIDNISLVSQQIIIHGTFKFSNSEYFIDELKIMWFVDFMLPDYDDSSSINGTAILKHQNDFILSDCDGPEILNFTTDLKLAH